MLVIKKLLLAITAGLIAASAFYWYLDKENPLVQMAEHYQQSGAKPIQLPDLSGLGFDRWSQDTASETIAPSVANTSIDDLAREATHAAESDAGMDRLTAHWVGGVLDRAAIDLGRPPLDDTVRSELVDILMTMRASAQDFARVRRDGGELGNARKLSIAATMAKGEKLFSQHLGVPLSEFMASLTKKDLKILLDQAPSA